MIASFSRRSSLQKHNHLCTQTEVTTKFSKIKRAFTHRHSFVSAPCEQCCPLGKKQILPDPLSLSTARSPCGKVFFTPATKGTFYPRKQGFLSMARNAKIHPKSRRSQVIATGQLAKTTRRRRRVARNGPSLTGISGEIPKHCPSAVPRRGSAGCRDLPPDSEMLWARN